MEQQEFQNWLSRIDNLTKAQRKKAFEALSGRNERDASLAAIEQGMDEDLSCPHCEEPGAVRLGKNRGLLRYRCADCGRTFNSLTGTSVARLHKKDKWLEFGRCLAEGLSVRASAKRCGIAVSTAFRWRHRFLKAVDKTPQKLKGIVEADETYILQSRKGERNLNRKPRRRGGKASKRGLSREQVPILIAADRGGLTASTVLEKVNSKTLHQALEPVVEKDILLVSDGNMSYPMCAQALGIGHEALNLSRGERTRGVFHIQTVNNRHSRLKNFLARYKGVATKYLDNYLRWFHLVVLEKNPTPRSCLAAAMNKSYMQIEN